jgi:uncharacterized membrane protein YsdA (DUF1294 family)
VLFAVFWLTFCFGITDFSAVFARPGDTSGVDVGVLGVAYGAIAAVILPLAFLSQVRAPQRRTAAVQQIAAVAVAFALAGILGLDPLSFISVATLVIMLAVILRLHPARPSLLPDTRQVSRPVLMVAAVAAIPWAVYGLNMASNSRERLPPDDLAARPQAGGWAGATAMALCVIVLAVLTSTRTPGWRIPLWSAALTGLSFGITSAMNPGSPGSAGRLWGTLATAWSIALVMAAELHQASRAGHHRLDAPADEP